MKTFTITAAVGMAFATIASAECGIEAGSVRILGNDFDAISIVTDEARTCASDDVEVTVNLTTEHKNIQVPALSIDPAEYTVAIVANNSIVPLLNDGLIRPLDDLIARYGEDLSPQQMIRVGGETVAIAFMGNAQHLYFRSDVLEEAGVEPPETYEDVLAAAEAIRAAGIQEHPLAATNAAGWYLAAEFVNMHLGMGGDFFEAGTAEPAIENEAGVATLEMMKALSEYMGPDFLNYTADEMKALYLAGDVAIMNQWGSMAGAHIDGETSGNADVSEATVLAAAPTVGGGSIPAAALWWDGFAIAANVSDEDAAASFQAMLHATRPEVAAANPNAATWLIPGFEPTETSQAVLATARAGALAYPMTPQMGLLHTALGAELTDFMQGNETAEEALADVAASYRVSAREAGFLQ
ncbi:extracellular solute-binding protein [Jannaschia sp. LMIT008]|uniref:extracellular solute-binding protein n=1 Tax=Jannaschia maritima TaxID=3032585 RepID=UPI00281176CC|nr:extracellular solute-binding protein [Jannaschia sp. LMIT008]